MPVTTTSNNPPVVDVTVTNGAGGGAAERFVLYVAWEPDALEASDPHPKEGLVYMPSEGVCMWRGHAVTAGNPKVFSLTLRRKNGDSTWVMACKMAPAEEVLESYCWEVSNRHPAVGAGPIP